MGKVHIFFRIIAGLLAFVLICATALALLHSNAWWIRVFDFPRIQIAILIGLTIAGYAVLHFLQRLRPWEYGLGALVVVSLIWQLIAIAPYTALYPEEMASSQDRGEANRITLLVFNVLAENRKVDALLELVRETDPDVILLTEPDHWWREQLEGLEEEYPHRLHQPQDNHYGMLLYSRLELVDPEIRFLIESAVPSIRTKVRLPSGELVMLYGVHPRPPGIDPPNDGQDEREDSDMRDAELMIVAKEVKRLGNVPVIVAGDFNDVAWSHTTHLFQRVGGMLDPRVGRGLFNTFDTKSRFMRYPLDHSFATRHFLLNDMRRLPDIGSDHFPLLVTFDYDPRVAEKNDEPQEDAGDSQEASNAIQEGRSDD